MTLSGGTNTLSAGFTAAYFDGADVYYETSFSNSAYYTGTTPPPTDYPALEDYGRCALSCFAATYAQGTVPYFSLDTPRNVTLVYNGDRVDPKPFVHVDYTIPGALPSWLQLRLHRVGGADITFLNGETALRFSAPATGTWRLGGQFSAVANGMDATSAYLVEVIVGQMIGGNLQETVVETRRLIVVNEAGSPVARGWTLAGVQRLYPISGGGALITEGDGSAVYFAWNGTSFVAPAGEFSRLTGTGGWVRAYPDSTKVTFNSSGYMTSVADRFGNTTSIGYTGANVTSITDPQGIHQTLGYGSYGLASIAALGRTTSVSVPSASRLLMAITDPDNGATQFGYDGSQRLSTVTDRAGATTTLSYHSPSGKLDSITAPAVTIYTGQSIAPRTRFTAWHLASVPYVATLLPSAPFTPVATSQVQATVIDPDSHITRFTANRMGQPLVTTPPVGATTSVTYTPAFLPTVVTHPTGVRDTTLYNADGLATYVRPWGQAATSIFYTAGRWAQPDSAKGASQPTVINRIGVSGRIDTVKVNGNATAFTYDTRGRVVSRRDPGGHVVSTVFEGVNGNRDRATVPGNRTIRYYQDSYGRDTAVVAPERPRQRVVYDVLNRVVEQYDSAGASPTRNWWGTLRLDSVGDPVGYRHRFFYNALGWVTRRTDPAGAWDSLRYDRDGQVRSWTNRRGQAVSRAYDAAHRPTSKSGDSTASESWSYSSDGRVVTATSPFSAETLYLDSAGRRLDSARTVMAGQTYWRRYRYTTAGLLDSVWVTGGTIAFTGRHYGYTSAGTLNEVRLNGATPTSPQHNSEQLLSQVTMPSGESVARGYNGLHAVSTVNATAGAPSAFFNAVFNGAAYDSLGRIVREIRNVEGTGMGVDYAGSGYTYDPDGAAAGRIHDRELQPASELRRRDDRGRVRQQFWLGRDGWHDVQLRRAVGNRTDRGGTYTTGNRMTAFDGCIYSTSPDGNVIRRTGGACGSDSLAWTAEGRLARIARGATAYTFHYDAMGRLVRRDVNGAVDRHFLWDGDNLLAELDAAGTGKVAEYSYWGLDRLHATILGTTPYFGHQDVRGNTLSLTASGQGYRRYWYDAWGTLTSGGETPPFNGADRARWKGALSMGPVLDLYYMRNRWYEPRTGRFLSEDPIGLAGGVNPYLFGQGDPINHRDPSGLKCERMEVWYGFWENGEFYPQVFLGYTGNGAGCEPGGDAGSGVGSLDPCKAQTLAGPIWVEETMANDAVAAINEAWNNGWRGRIEASFRTFEEQIRIKDGPRGRWAAEPGWSPHEATAFDLTYWGVPRSQRAALLGAMSNHGFVRNVPGEPWHFEHRSTAQDRTLRGERISDFWHVARNQQQREGLPACRL